MYSKLAMNKIILSLLLIYPLTSIGNKKEYLIGVEYEQRYPFYYEQNGDFKGRTRKILDMFAKSQKIKFKYKIGDRESLYQDLHEEKIDFKFPDSPSWSLPYKINDKIIYSDAITHNLDCIFTNTEYPVHKKSQISNFGIVKDIILRDMDKKTKSGNINITKKKSCGDLLVMLSKKDLDAIFCDFDVVKFLIKNSSLSKKIAFNANFPFIDHYHYISTLRHVEMISKFDIWIKNNRIIIEQHLHEN